MKKPTATKFFFILLAFFGTAGFSSGQQPEDWSKSFKLCWQFPLGDKNLYAPFGDDFERVFLPLTDGTLTAIEGNNGNLLWQNNVGGEFTAEPVYSDKKIYLLTEFQVNNAPNFVLRSVSALTGLTLWQIKISAEPFETAHIFTDETSVFLITETGFIFNINKTDGNINWLKNLSLKISGKPNLSGNRLFLGTQDSFLILSAQNGNLLNKVNLKSGVSGNSAVFGEVLFFGDTNGNLFAYNLREKEFEWKSRIGAGASDISDIYDDILVSSNDGFVYFISKKSGNREKKFRFDGRLLGKPSINKNYILVQTIDGIFATVLDNLKGKVVNKIMFYDEAFSIADSIKLKNSIVIATNQGLQSFGVECGK